MKTSLAALLLTATAHAQLAGPATIAFQAATYGNSNLAFTIAISSRVQ